MNSRNLIKTALGLVLIVLTMSCDKQEDDPTSPPSTETTLPTSNIELLNFMKQNEIDYTQKFSINTTEETKIIGKEGTQLIFPANCFQTLDGESVTGKVELNLIEVYKKSDMIFLNKPTMAYNPNGEGLLPLISGGEFKITASQDGKELKIKPNTTYTLTTKSQDNITSDMQFFTGIEKNDTLTWVQSDSSNITINKSDYLLNINALNWINCDYFYSNPNQQSLIRVKLPKGFNINNCSLFISFDGMTSITQLYGFEEGLITSAPYYKLPIDLDVHFIALSYINQQPYYSISSSKIQNNHLEVLSDLKQITKEDLKKKIELLP